MPGTFQTILHGFIMTPICIVGLFGNFLSAIVLTQAEMKSSTSTLLLGLTVWDTVFIMIQLSYTGIPTLFQFFDICSNYVDAIHETKMTTYFFFFFNISRICSVYFTLGTTVERYLAVCYPFDAGRRCSKKVVIGYSILMSLCSIGISLPRLFEIEVNITELEEIQYHYTEFGESYLYILYNELVIPILVYVFPFGSLTLLNTLIYLEIRRSNKAREQLTQTQTLELSVAKMLVFVVLVFGVCHSPLAIIMIYYKFYDDEVHTINTFYIFTITLNSSINFIIYCTMGQRFRESFFQVLGKFRRKYLPHHQGHEDLDLS